MAAEAEAKVQNATDVKGQSEQCSENTGEERWERVKRPSEIHPAFADCVEVRQTHTLTLSGAGGV